MTSKAARAHEFILRLPDGYDSFVGERGQQLSGGERQRISIARALLIDPALLILDEATANTDPQSEHEIHAALTNLSRGRTVLIVAHRLATITDADNILVIDDGHLVEQGDHAELLASDGLYTSLWRQQNTMEGTL